jgi:predicted transcriptional regulator
MARILVDLPNDQIQDLVSLAEVQQRPRAAVIRDAIAVYLDDNKHRPAVDVFGLWEGRDMEGLKYQQELREEW